MNIWLRELMRAVFTPNKSALTKEARLKEASTHQPSCDCDLCREWWAEVPEQDWRDEEGKA